MSSNTGSRFSAVAAAFVCLVSSPVLATPFPSDAVIFTMRASSSIGQGSFDATFGQGTYNEVTHRFVWQLLNPVLIVDSATSLPLAKLLSARLEYWDDPFVSLEFSTQGIGGVPLDYFIGAAALPFPTISPAQGRCSAGMSVTDTGSDGASITGLEPGGGSYRAQYNGIPGTAFAQLLPSIIAGPGSSNSAAASSPGGGLFSPIADPVSDISAEFHFTLSTGDLASGTSHWEVVPGPSVVGVMLLGVAGLVRRRRAA